ncbi:MAG: hypothetical protein KAT68_15955 [Bacteroidales bacterium]|nr:hypothetical protein [Bacteroidales bacterium]
MEKGYWNEQWEEIKIKGEYTNPKHDISNYGRVKRYLKDKKTTILKPVNIKGYDALILMSVKKKPFTTYIHKMVGEAFVEKERDDQRFVIHVDYNKQNNHTKNLKWADKWELAAHHRKNPNGRKRKITNSKLDETKVKLIKKLLLRDNTRLKMIAKKFGISHTQLNRIRSGENWGYVKID